jgi:hypothetical protein
MRVASSRVATVAMVLIGLAALAVAGRLVRITPSAEHPVTSAAVTIPPAATATTLDSVEVPDAFGQRLAQAKMVMRAAGCGGAAEDRDPQVPGAVVVVQEPAAGTLVPWDSVVGFRTRTDVQANGVVRRLRLGAGQTTTTYLVVAPDPPTHPLMMVVTCRVPLGSGCGWKPSSSRGCRWWAGGRIRPAASPPAPRSAAWFGWGRSTQGVSLASGPRGLPSIRRRQR